MKKWLVIAFMLPFLVVAQEEESENNLGTTISQGEGQRIINVNQKLAEMPVTYDTTIELNTWDYPHLIRTYESTYMPEPIPAARLRVIDPLDKLYRGYLRAGIGLYTTPLLDFYFAQERDRYDQWGVHYKHLSSWDGIKDYANSQFMNNRIELFGRHMMNNDLYIHGSGYFNHDYLNFYGLPDSLGYDPKRLRQRYTGFGLKGGIGSYYEDSTRLNYQVNLEYNYFGDLNDNSDSLKFDYTRENHFLVDAVLRKYIEKNVLLDINTSLDFNNNVGRAAYFCEECDSIRTTNPINNAIFRLNPGIVMQAKFFTLNAGFDFSLSLPDPERETTVPYIYPDVEMRFNLFDNILIPYVGVDGKLERNSFRSMATENPFVLSQLELRNSSHKIRIFGGLRGAFSRRITFDASAYYSRIDNVPLFVLDSTYSLDNRFDVVYDEIIRTRFHGQVAYNKSEKIRIMLEGDWFINDPVTEERAWNLPQYRFMLSGMYNLGDKIIIRLDGFVVGGRYARRLFPTSGESYSIKLNDYADINLGVEYRYSRRLSAFLNLNNIAGARYQRWLNYPVQGFGLLGGITYSF